MNFMAETQNDTHQKSMNGCFQAECYLPEMYGIFGEQ
jgi:hypothetical protein